MKRFALIRCITQADSFKDTLTLTLRARLWCHRSGKKTLFTKFVNILMVQTCEEISSKAHHEKNIFYHFIFRHFFSHSWLRQFIFNFGTLNRSHEAEERRLNELLFIAKKLLEPDRFSLFTIIWKWAIFGCFVMQRWRCRSLSLHQWACEKPFECEIKFFSR